MIAGLYNFAYDSPTVNYQGNSSAILPSLFYKATLGFEINRSMGWAISAYPWLGLNLTVDSQTGSSGGFGVGLPVYGELFFGELDDACFFMGAGFSANYIKQTTLFGDFDGGPVVGPSINIGGQFEFRDQLIGLRASYTLGINKIEEREGITITEDKKSAICAGIYYVFD